MQHDPRLNTHAAIGFFPSGLGEFPGSSLSAVPTSKHKIRTLLLMAFGIAAVVIAENWDARQQSRAALDLLTRRHELLALALLPRLSRLEGEKLAGRSLESELCETTRELERTGPVVVLFRLSGDDTLRSCHGPAPRIHTLEGALHGGATRATLTREEAALLGLRERIAVAGIARLAGVSGASLAVVGSAGNERDRSRRQQVRALSSIGVVSTLILGLGVMVLRKQKREIALEQQVELERTRQERDAELAKANRMATMAALASGFAHEIGTPLGIIAGRIEQLQTSPLAPERRHELLAKVKVQIDRIDQLLRSFLSFARGDAPILAKRPFAELVQNAALLVRHRFASAGVELRLELGAAGGVQVVCEPALLEQAIVNVLINALEASSREQVVAVRLDREPRFIVLFITDSGAGIPAVALERVTEPFFTTKAKRGGSGLGLTIVKEIVAHHRGELVVRRRTESAGDGSGTEVAIRLPCVEVF
jgi:signal transduction histidine kinase